MILFTSALNIKIDYILLFSLNDQEGEWKNIISIKNILDCPFEQGHFSNLKNSTLSLIASNFVTPCKKTMIFWQLIVSSLSYEIFNIIIYL